MGRKKLYTILSVLLALGVGLLIWLTLTGGGIEKTPKKPLNDKPYAQMGIWTGKNIRLDYGHEEKLQQEKEEIKQELKAKQEKSKTGNANKINPVASLVRNGNRGDDTISGDEDTGKDEDDQEKPPADDDKKPPKDEDGNPSDDGVDKTKIPTIITNLVDEKVYAEAYATFYVEGKDYLGRSIIWPGEYKVTLNGVELDYNKRFDYRSHEIGRNYQTALSQGENKITISLKDEDGNLVVKKFTVYGDRNKKPDATDMIDVYVVLDLSNVGLEGIGETKLRVRGGISAQKLVYDFFTSRGYTVNNGDTASQYLAVLSKPGMTKGFSFSERQKKDLAHYGDISTIKLRPDSLGQMDTTGGSGYMWSLNGNKDHGMGLGQYAIADGDYIEVWWTNDYGQDYKGR